MRKAYCQPKGCIEYFKASEYVSNCLYTYCQKAHGVTHNNILDGNSTNGFWDNMDSSSGENHRAEYCGRVDHYSINPATGSGYELETDGQGALPIYGLVWEDTNGNREKDQGDWVSWYTGKPDGRHWYHYGQLAQQDDSHPNRS